MSIAQNINMQLATAAQLSLQCFDIKGWLKTASSL